MPRVIMLVGAPPSLEYKETDLTVSNFLPAFESILDTEIDGKDVKVRGEDRNKEKPVLASESIAKWRSIPLIEEQLHTGWSQPDWMGPSAYIQGETDQLASEDQPELSFLTSTGSLADHNSQAGAEAEIETSELSQHLEQSFALHEEAPSSQVTPVAKTPLFQKRQAELARPDLDDDSRPDLSITSAATVLEHATSGILTEPKTPLRTNRPSILPYLTDISTLPSTSGLISLEPQTVTVDLLVGVISVGPVRTVKIHQTGQHRDLVEVLVGDETRAGFSVTFWLSDGGRNNGPSAKQELETSFRAAVQNFRAGDIIGLRNVALRHFRGRVHGTTLGRRGKTGGETQIQKLCEAGGVPIDQIGGRAANKKFQRVWAWTKNFVRSAASEGPSRVTKRKRDSDEDLPPDETQMTD